MKKMLLLAVAFVLVAGVASATIVDTKHDMRTYITGAGTTTQVCVFCHTPHGTAGTNIKPLWNHSLSQVTSYGVYTSDTMNATTADLGAGTSTSHLCLSCHDGTVAVNAFIKNPTDQTASGTYSATLTGTGTIATTSGGYLGTLENDHPVNISYSGAITNGDTGLFTTPSASLVLFGASQMVQCATCHQVHDNTYAPFLRMSNAASALCISCHNK